MTLFLGWNLRIFSENPFLRNFLENREPKKKIHFFIFLTFWWGKTPIFAWGIEPYFLWGMRPQDGNAPYFVGKWACKPKAEASKTSGFCRKLPRKSSSLEICVSYGLLGVFWGFSLVFMSEKLRVPVLSYYIFLQEWLSLPARHS